MRRFAAGVRRARPLGALVDRRTQAGAYYLVCQFVLGLPWLAASGVAVLAGVRVHVAAGVATAVLPVLLGPPLAAAHLAILHRVLGVRLRPGRPGRGRAVAATAAVSLTGPAGAFVAAMAWFITAALLASPLRFLVDGRGAIMLDDELAGLRLRIDPTSLPAVLACGAAGVLAVPACLWLTRGCARLQSAFVARLLNGGAGQWELDQRRAAATELRRDLHDGVQPSLVALALELDLARQASPDAGTRDRLERAHAGARQALDELRAVTAARPTTAAELPAAVRAVAERLGLAIELDVRLPRHAAPDTVSAAYFIAAESLVNVAKHAGTRAADVTLGACRGTLTVRVRDSGRGGAVPAGGLTGLAARTWALGGRFEITSPPGGPTTVDAELPCES